MIVKVSDKDKQFVVSSKLAYIEHSKKLLDDKKTYEKLSKNPLKKCITDVEKIIKNNLPSCPQEVKEMLPPHLPRIPEFYTTWKIHKNNKTKHSS